MAEFVEIIKTRERMCDYYKLMCIKCPLSIDNNKSRMVCPDMIIRRPEKTEQIIMKWARKNPVQTNADKFKEVFGVGTHLKGCDGLKCGYDGDCKNCDMKNFWEKEYKEPKGEDE